MDPQVTWDLMLRAYASEEWPAVHEHGSALTAMIGDSLAGLAIRNVQFKFQSIHFISQCRSVQPQDLRSL